MDKTDKKIKNLEMVASDVFVDSRFRAWAIKVIGICLSIIFVLPLGLIFVYFGIQAFVGEVFEAVPWVVAVLLIGFGVFWCVLAMFFVYKLLKRR